MQFSQKEAHSVETEFDQDADGGSIDLENCYMAEGNELVPLDRILYTNKARSNYVKSSLPAFNRPSKTYHPNRNAVNFVPRTQVLKCYQCNKTDHAVWTCPDFASLGLNLRMNLVREKSLCLKCLNTGHRAINCKVKFLCDVNKCGGHHHRLLHSDKPTRQMLQLFQSQGFEDDLFPCENESQLSIE